MTTRENASALLADKAVAASRKQVADLQAAVEGGVAETGRRDGERRRRADKVAVEGGRHLKVLGAPLSRDSTRSGKRSYRRRRSRSRPLGSTTPPQRRRPQRHLPPPHRSH